MRTSLSLAAATVLLLLLLTTAMEVKAIRLDAESRAAVVNQQKVANKPSDNLTQQKDAPGKTKSSTPGSGESEAKRSVAISGQEELVRATAHKLPEFHEDYYGASVHEPRHH